MKQLILHIGTHKTGTTSLQRFLLENAELLSSQGLGVPKTPSKYPKRNQDRTASFLSMEARKELNMRSWRKGYARRVASDKACVRESVAQYDTVCLSDERIWYDAAIEPQFWSIIKNTAEQLGFDTFKIVVYLRRQDEFVSSLWAELVKTREKAPLNEYMFRESISKVLDYNTVLDTICSVFGEDIVVRVYSRSSLIDGDICRDFCDAIGITWDESFVLPESTNPSLSANLAAIKQVANNAKQYEGTNNYLKRFAMEASKENKTNPAILLTLEERDKLLSQYASGNAEVARRFLNRDDGVLFAQPSPTKEEWTPFTPEMFRDMCYFYTEALSAEHEKVRVLQKGYERLELTEKAYSDALAEEIKKSHMLEKRLDKTEKRLDRLDHVYRNSIVMKLERFIRGRSKLERKP